MATRLPALYLKDLIHDENETGAIIFHKSQGNLLEDQNLFQNYHELFCDYLPDLTGQEEKREWNWNLRLQINKSKCILRNITLEIIALRIIQLLTEDSFPEQYYSIFFSTPFDENWILSILFAFPVLWDQDKYAIRAQLWSLKEKFFALLIDGRPSIREAQPIEVNETKEWIVETLG